MKEILEKENLDMGFSTTKGYYIGFKVTLVLEKDSRSSKLQPDFLQEGSFQGRQFRGASRKHRTDTQLTELGRRGAARLFTGPP